MTKIIFLLFFPSVLWATPEQTQHLKEVVQQYKSHCSAQVCQEPFAFQVLYDRTTRMRSPKFTPEVFKRFRQAAAEQAQIWGDTILEGDYYAAGHTRVDAVVAIYKGQEIVAYHILYSEKSWDTGTCEYDGHRSSLADCEMGRIAESSFALPDLQTMQTDEDDYAEFEPGATANSFR